MTFNPFQPQQTAPVSAPQGSPFSPSGSQPPQGANPFGQPAQFAPSTFQQQAFQQPAAPQLAAYMFQGMGSANDSDRSPPLPESGHEEVEIGDFRIELSTDPNKPQGTYLVKVDLIVVRSTTCAPGTKTTAITKFTNHKWPKQKEAAFAQLRNLIAAAYGMDGDSPEVRAQFDSTVTKPDGTQVPASMDMILGCQSGAIKGKKITIKSTKTTHFPAKPPQFPRASSITEYRYGPLGSPVEPLRVQAPVAAAPAFAAPTAAFGPVFPPTGWVADGTGCYIGVVNGAQHRVSENDLRTAQAAGRV